MNRRSFLSAGIGALSLPIVPGCNRRSSAPQPGAGVADTQKVVWILGPRDSFADGVSARYAAKTAGAVFVVRGNRKIYALSSICTHLGCVIDVAGDGFACGCHGSRYALDGTRLSGPAKRPLVRYGISVNDSDQIVIDRSVTYAPAHADDLGSFVFIY